MSLLFCLVLAISTLITTRALPLTEDLCDQDHKTCHLIQIAGQQISHLLRLVTGKQFEVRCNECKDLLEAEDVTSFEDFYLEMTKYNDLLQSIDSAFKVYLTTTEWFYLSFNRKISSRAQKYNRILTNSRTNMLLLVQELNKKLNQKMELVDDSITDIPQWNDFNKIRAVTFYVTQSLKKLLQTWRMQCKQCLHRMSYKA